MAAGVSFGAALIAIGLLARWYPSFDIVNNGLPFVAVGALALLAIAFALRQQGLIAAAATLFLLTLALLVAGLSGTAPQAPGGAERFLRVATFNLWGRADHRLDLVASFLAQAEPDVVVLQEVRPPHATFLEALAGRYPYRVGDNGLAILSKYRILTDGRIDRAGQPLAMSLTIRWVQLDVNGTSVEIAGVHVARPFYPDLQEADIAVLTTFAKERRGPLIVAGDFNMSPWTVKLKAFTHVTGLGRFNTFLPTWPMRWKRIPLLPLLPIDNVFASPHFANISTTVGPRLDSDHRPVIADIALVK